MPKTAAKPKPKPAAKPPTVRADSHFRIEVNGHTLTGTNAGGVWAFECPEWPDLVELHAGEDYPQGIAGDFTMRALLRPAA